MASRGAEGGVPIGIIVFLSHAFPPRTLTAFHSHTHVLHPPSCRRAFHFPAIGPVVQVQHERLSTKDQI